MDAAEYEAQGLYDPNAPKAQERLELLNWLADQGITIEQMVDAMKFGSLTGLAGDLRLRPGPKLTLAEVAEKAGMSSEAVDQIRRAAGFPPVGPVERLFTEGDANSFAAFAFAVDMFGERAMLQFTRVTGAAMATIAETAIWSFLTNVEAPLMEREGTELELAQANLQASQVMDTAPAVLETIFRVHVETAIRRTRQTRLQYRSYEGAHLAVGFVDLVGFTSISQELAPHELREVIDEFESQAFNIVSEHDGRIVKFIGDEVMFVALDGRSACEVALELLETFGKQERAIQPRGGLAVGELLTAAGDYFGPVVNAASRIAELAVPNEILVTTETRNAAEPSFGLAFDPAGRRLLKGFDEPLELFALRRA
jgi:adenylate cyclase